MPPRHNYWTIIFGNQPTSFRTATQEELLPTFRQIQSKHADAVMMWFAHGRLWKSPEEARETRMRHRATREVRRARSEARPPSRPGPGGTSTPGSPEHRGGDGRTKDRWRNRPPAGDRPAPPKARGGEGRPRGRDWRPGGDHKDPRDRFKVPRDVKRARFKARLRRDRARPKKDDE
jgi:hypothetical protein